eukprot:SAG11_NODE_10206_length_847_cov_1.270053_1_plen_65_part_01
MWPLVPETAEKRLVEPMVNPKRIYSVYEHRSARRGARLEAVTRRIHTTPTPTIWKPIGGYHRSTC